MTNIKTCQIFEHPITDKRSPQPEALNSGDGVGSQAARDVN